LSKAIGRTCPTCGKFHKFGEFPVECQESYVKHVGKVIRGEIPPSAKTLANIASDNRRRALGILTPSQQAFRRKLAILKLEHEIMVQDGRMPDRPLLFATKSFTPPASL
jgi:hypothetical protein